MIAKSAVLFLECRFCMPDMHDTAHCNTLHCDILHSAPISSMQTCMIGTAEYTTEYSCCQAAGLPSMQTCVIGTAGYTTECSCCQAAGLPSMLHGPTSAPNLTVRPHVANANWAELREPALCSLSTSHNSLSCETDSTTCVYNGGQGAILSHMLPM